MEKLTNYDNVKPYRHLETGLIVYITKTPIRASNGGQFYLVYEWSEFSKCYRSAYYVSPTLSYEEWLTRFEPEVYKSCERL